MKICKVSYCKRGSWSWGYCRRHDAQVRAHGEVKRNYIDGNLIKIHGNLATVYLGENGKHGKAIIDRSEVEIIKKYYWNRSTGYAYSNKQENKKRIMMHRLIMNDPKGKYIDHINGDKLDNRKENLRICTNSQNLMNRGKSFNNKSGYKGVSKRSDYGYRAEIRLEGKKYYAGSAKTPEEAARMYDKKCIELHGEFAVTNFKKSDYLLC